jgi:DNA replication licensing factor MCM3
LSFRAPGECDGDVISDKPLLHIDQTYKEVPMYETWPVAGSSKKLLSCHFVRKYLSVARCIRPKLTDITSEMIHHEYARIRQLRGLQTQPITPRALYSLIRLATAHAKARLSPTIDECDALGAFELFAFAIQNKPLEKTPR